MSAVYFDHNATTPLDVRVREAMLPWLGERHGNPSSVHRFGRAAREAVEEGREHIAALINASPGQIVFTSSGTEANNAVVLGQAHRRAAGHLVVSAMEHPSIQAAADRLESWGWSVSRASPDRHGRLAPQQFLDLLREETALVCVMLANNEIGTLQPIPEIAGACRGAGVPVLCDAVQAAGKVLIDVEELGVDYLTLGAHKFHGPLGAAALWVRPDRALDAFLVGGGQERRQRAGTENVAAIVGFGRASKLAREELADRQEALARLRDHFEERVRTFANVEIHGIGAPRLPNTSNLAFLGLPAESLMIRLDLQGFAVSAGAACSSGKVERSLTLAAIGVSEDDAASSMRVSFGITNRIEEVDRLIEVLRVEVPALADRLGSAK